MDTSVSIQGKNNDYENKSLVMVLMANICRCISLTSWQSVAASNHPNQTLGDMIGMIWPQVLSPEKGYFGVGVMLSQPCCYGYHGYDRNRYLKLFFY